MSVARLPLDLDYKHGFVRCTKGVEEKPARYLARIAHPFTPLLWAYQAAGQNVSESIVYTDEYGYSGDYQHIKYAQAKPRSKTLWIAAYHYPGTTWGDDLYFSTACVSKEQASRSVLDMANRAVVLGFKEVTITEGEGM